MTRGAKPTLHPSAADLDASWDRDRDRAPIAKREPPTIEPWWCVNPFCDGYTDRGSYALNRCTRCGTARPVHA